jgi:hypothetical protein
MQSISKQLRAIGELLGLDCGDNSCLAAARKGGMRTNGGCTCDFVGAVAKLREELSTAEDKWLEYGSKLARVEALANEHAKWIGVDDLRDALKGEP